MEDYKLLGLEEKEYRTYELLLEKGELFQAQIAKELGFSKPTAKRMCDQLIKKDWIKSLDLGDEVIYKAIDPQLVYKTKSEKINDSISKLKRLFEEQQGLPKVRIIDNLQDLRDIQEDLLKNAKEIFTLTDKSNDNYKKNITRSKKMEEHLVDGKKYYSLYTVKDKNQKIQKYNNEHTFVSILDTPHEVRGGLEVWNDNVYIKKAINSTLGIYIKNQNVADIMKFLIKMIIKNSH